MPRDADYGRIVNGFRVSDRPRYSAVPPRVEAEWIDISHLGNPGYEEQMDVRSEPSAYRHRPLLLTGEAVTDWFPGPAPQAGQ